MSDLQKIVVLCFFGTLFIGGTFFVAPLFISFDDIQRDGQVLDQVDVPAQDIELRTATSEDTPYDLPVLEDGKVIDSFEDCVAAGHSVMESYPAMCRASGVLFVQKISDGLATTTEEAADKEPVACARDAKICPDGSSVGRVGPNCEFAACPGESIESPVGESIFACTMDAKECPDGSFVGRTGPNCEFAACPGE